MDNLNFNDLEIISKITSCYQKEIESYLMDKHKPINQENFSKCVYQLFNKYKNVQSTPNVLKLIEEKFISLRDS